MGALIKELQNAYESAMAAGDTRVENWPLMGSPFPALAIVLAYNVFIRLIGPKIMEKRPPMELKKFMIAYNLLLIGANAHFVYAAMVYVWFPGRFHLYKEPIDYSDDPFAVYIASMVYFFFVSKILDLFDTVFIVFRKKSTQLSFLHTYHHSVMIIVTWVTTKYIAGGSVIIVGTINAFVHVLMYTYYLLTLVDPEYKKSVWWKRHLTELQLLQFILDAVIGLLIIWYSKCIVLTVVCGLLVPQDTFFFIMFFDFYIKTYFTKKVDDVKKD